MFEYVARSMRKTKSLAARAKHLDEEIVTNVKPEGKRPINRITSGSIEAILFGIEKCTAIQIRHDLNRQGRLDCRCKKKRLNLGSLYFFCRKLICDYAKDGEVLYQRLRYE